jgi:ankyrin repeat protein
MTPLHWAAELGLTEMIPLLLVGGADLEAKDADGKTPLMVAVDYGQTAAEAALRALGAKD